MVQKTTMNIAVIGTGYVGLVQAVGLAELGFVVVGVDIDQQKIAKLQNGQSPIYEPGLQALLKRNLKTKRLSFTTDIDDAVKNADVIFIAVGTPSHRDSSVDLRYVRKAAQAIGKALDKARAKYRVVANKSTVPIGTGDFVTKIIRRYYRGPFDVISNPEFLREGQAVNDFFKPDRVVVGDSGGSARARKIITTIYRKLKAPILFTDVKTAELIKYASNSFLATSISFINSLSWLAEKVDADITAVSQGMKLDQRIGPRAFLTTGPGYGGSCFPKDVAGLLAIAKKYKIELPILNAALEINQKQRDLIIKKVINALGKLKGKTIAVWGLAFKAQTDDIRESPAVAIINELLRLGAKIRAYDPVAEINTAKIYPQISFSDSPHKAAWRADLLLILTEWPEFARIKPATIKRILKSPNLVDGRNLFDPKKMKAAGINYQGIGR